MGVSIRANQPLATTDDLRHACRDVADLLDQAQSVVQFRRALVAQRHLWRAVRTHLAEGSLPLPPEDRGGLRGEARFILDACESPGSPSDMQVEAFIAINRRLARALARAPRPPGGDARAGRLAPRAARPGVTAGFLA